MGSGRLRIGRIGIVAFRARRVSQAGREGAIGCRSYAGCPLQPSPSGGVTHVMPKSASRTRKRAARLPRRVQLRRTKGWRMPANTVKVDRTTLFGNPFSIADYGHDRAVELHRRWIAGERVGSDLQGSAARDLAAKRSEVLQALPTLRGKNLACWCALPKPGEPDRCHAAVLLELANR